MAPRAPAASGTTIGCNILLLPAQAAPEAGTAAIMHGAATEAVRRCHRCGAAKQRRGQRPGSCAAAVVRAADGFDLYSACCSSCWEPAITRRKTAPASTSLPLPKAAAPTIRGAAEAACSPDHGLAPRAGCSQAPFALPRL